MNLKWIKDYLSLSNIQKVLKYFRNIFWNSVLESVNSSLFAVALKTILSCHSYAAGLAVEVLVLGTCWLQLKTDCKQSCSTLTTLNLVYEG